MCCGDGYIPNSLNKFIMTSLRLWNLTILLPLASDAGDLVTLFTVRHNRNNYYCYTIERKREKSEAKIFTECPELVDFGGTLHGL